MRRILKWVFRIALGIILGVVVYEGILFLRVYWLRDHNPSSTSLIDTRLSEAQARGQEPRREQTWVPIDKISPNLQRAVLAGEDTNFLTHNGFDYQAIQKAYEQAQREAAKEAKKEGEDDDWLPSLPEFKRGGSLSPATRQEPLSIVTKVVHPKRSGGGGNSNARTLAHKASHSRDLPERN